MVLQGSTNDATARLVKYLNNDKAGIRKAMLALFLFNREYTTEQIFRHLSEQGFDISYRGTSAMVGLMNTRLGIMRIDVAGDHNTYSLKDGYINAVRSVLGVE